MEYAIEVSGLEKAFGSFKAVNDVNFSIEKDKIYGLLGRNGAGKTTLMKLITAQIFPTGGNIKVFGEDPYENREVLTQICFIKESQKYPDHYTIRDAMAVAKSIFPNWDEEFALSLMDEFRLPSKRRIKKLSRGMHSAVGIVIGLASRASITIFDEPYLGLDAVSRNVFYDRLMDDYGEHPRTVILSTHLIDEVSNLLEHIFVMADGELILDQDAENLRGMAFTLTGRAPEVEAFISGKEVIHREPFGGLLSVTIIRDHQGHDLKQAETIGLEITPVSLQQLSIYLTTKSREQKGAMNK